MLSRLLATLAVLFWIVPANAGEVSGADAKEFQRIISEQIAAFNADDGAAAFAHASPMIRQMFATQEAFMTMVKQGYAPVYRQRSYSFGETAERIQGLPTQEVTILDAKGRSWVAVYTLQKQPDGSWKINGCSLVEVPAVDA